MVKCFKLNRQLEGNFGRQQINFPNLIDSTMAYLYKFGLLGAFEVYVLSGFHP
jgi:hypothetical protein